MNLFPALPSGGIYILEDLGTSFPAYRKRGFADASVSCYDFLIELNYIVTGGEKLAKAGLSKPIFAMQDILESLAYEIDMMSFIRESCIIIKK